MFGASPYNPGRHGLTPLLESQINYQDPQLHGLVAWYRFASQSGVTILDSTPFSRHGVFNNVGWINDGEAGMDVPDFNGTSSSVDIDYFKPPTGTSPRTVTAWVWPDVSNLDGTIAIWGHTGNGEKWSFRAIAGALRIEIAGSGYSSSLTLTVGAWNFVALTFSGTTLAGHNLFLNGTKEAASGANSVNTATNTGLWLGYNKVDNSQYWDGRIRDLRIYDRVLSDDLIEDIRLNPFRPFSVHGSSVPLYVPVAADDEALAWLAFNQQHNPSLPVGGDGALSDADRQQFLHVLRDPVWSNRGLSVISAQEQWQLTGL